MTASKWLTSVRLRLAGTAAKVLVALLPAGVVTALLGDALVAVVLLVVGVAAGASIPVLGELESRAKQREQERQREHEIAIGYESAHRQKQAARERLVRSALRVAVSTVADLDPEAVGVDPVDPKILEKALSVNGGQLTYVIRDVDHRLRTHLARARDGRGPALVCLHGPSKAGKSRTMFQALTTELAGAALVAPVATRRNLQSILDHDVLTDAAADGGGVVVLWLDDLEAFVRVGDDGLDASQLSKLKSELPGLVVAATVGGRGLVVHGGHSQSELHEPLNDLIATSAREYLLAGLTTPAEREALMAVVPPGLVEEMVRGLGAVAVSGERLVQILVSECHPGVDEGRRCTDGAALVWAAIAAYRLGLTEPVPVPVLRRLLGCYATTASDEDFHSAVRWATKPLYGHVALLRGDGDSLAPYDYLVQHAPSRGDEAGGCAWRELLASSGPAGAFELGIRAHQRGALEDAIAAFKRVDDSGDPAGSFSLGVLLMQPGNEDVEAAEAAFRRADERGHAGAAFYLGALLDQERGDPVGAEAAWRRADERGDADAAYSLGVLLRERGDLAGAEAAWRRADERGHAVGAWNLGLLLFKERDDLAGAEAAFRRADERADPDGAFNLGVLLQHERGDLKGAEDAYRRADERGAASGAFNLGLLLERTKGDLSGAEAAYRRADERGHAAAAFALGVLHDRKGDLDAAEAAWRRADERGHPDGAFNLGALLAQERGDLDGAEAAYRRADERGHALGAFNLGVLVLGERGDLEGAEAAWRRADERGHATAAFALGDLLRKERGDLDGAEAAWRRADERGHAAAAFALGDLLRKERGDLDGAEAAWRRADERGHAAAAFNLGVLVEERGNLAEAEAAYSRAAMSSNEKLAARARESLKRLGR